MLKGLAKIGLGGLVLGALTALAGGVGLLIGDGVTDIMLRPEKDKVVEPENVTITEEETE